MFSQKPCYFSQLSRSHPILKLVNIYDHQSFIRAYVLDNFYVCILMYILFYLTLWYANNIIKRIEKSNREMTTTVAENKTKLNRLVLLNNKKTEFEKVIVKMTDTQKVTMKYLEEEMDRLSTELITTSNKVNGLENMIEKMVFSTSAQTNYLVPTSKVKIRKNAADSRVQLRKSRFSNRHFHRPPHRNLRLGSTGSLSVDRQDIEDRHLRLRLRCQKSNSSNSASAETSPESVNRYPASKIPSRYNYQDGDRKRYFKKLFTKTRSRQSLCCNIATPFTKSLLGLANIFLRGYS
ncbi:hypothetical protein PUN28_008457 [Cardiocondyla obscurior]|uniref:Uncharacterized protein n=1 Tax=Cardiocondyla obscurior TaxID=286306 RepID=A0AAW2G3U8_9HYME